MNKRIQNEKEFHDDVFSQNKRSAVKKYYSITDERVSDFISIINRDNKNAHFLEIGCGPTNISESILENNGNFYGIDLSKVAVEQSYNQLNGQYKTPPRFLMMDAENLGFNSNTFDVICGGGILHHLNIERAMDEIVRVLRPGGKAVFAEPLGHNIFINFYRNFTPAMRTEDEHPLLLSDIKLMGNYFEKFTVHYYYMLTFASLLFKKTKLFLPLKKVLFKIDRFLFSHTPLKRWAWQVILEFHNPIKEK